MVGVKLVVGTADDGNVVSLSVCVCNVRAGYHPRLVLSDYCLALQCVSPSRYLHFSPSFLSNTRKIYAVVAFIGVEVRLSAFLVQT